MRPAQPDRRRCAASRRRRRSTCQRRRSRRAGPPRPPPTRGPIGSSRPNWRPPATASPRRSVPAGLRHSQTLGCKVSRALRSNDASPSFFASPSATAPHCSTPCLPSTVRETLHHRKINALRVGAEAWSTPGSSSFDALLVAADVGQLWRQVQHGDAKGRHRARRWRHEVGRGYSRMARWTKASLSFAGPGMTNG